jgi:Gpi18-like mannosyltransferase
MKALSSLGIECAATGAGVLLSHVAHYLSVVQLWHLTSALVAHPALAFTTGTLHIISPAGAFLSSPYSESLFSFLSMSGFLAYVSAARHFGKRQIPRACLGMILAGLSFGLATIVRSNGILFGIIFLIEALVAAHGILLRGVTPTRLVQLTAAVLAGALVGYGFAYPQFLAYNDYCYSIDVEMRRSWCGNTFPSIFAFVQSHYW